MPTVTTRRIEPPQGEENTEKFACWNADSHFGGAEPLASREYKLPGGTHKTYAVLVLLCLAGLIVVARLHTYSEPLERDLTTYAVIAHEMLQGRALYSDLWDHKPPGIHLTYAAAELLVGYGERAVFFLNVSAALLTLFGAYTAGSVTGFGRLGGLWAAAFWALVSGDLGLQANQPNTEAFINACVIWAFALMLRSHDGRAGWARTILIGVLFALASFYKPPIVVLAVLLVPANAVGTSRAERKSVAVRLSVIVGVVALFWALVFVYFGAPGHWEAFRASLFDYNRIYAGSIVENLRAAFSTSHLAPKLLAPLAPLFLLLPLGAVFGWKERRPAWVLLIALALGTQIIIALPGQFHAHYYQHWLPPLVIGAGWAVAEIGQCPLWRRRLAYVAGGVVLAVLVWFELPHYRLSPDEWSRRKYGEVFVTSKVLGTSLNELLGPGETFYEWGSETGLYFSSRRSPPTGLFYAHPFVDPFVKKNPDPFRDSPFLRQLDGRVLAELQRRPPELYVRYTDWREPPAVLQAWIDRHYQPFVVNKGFVLAALRGGTLEARLRDMGNGIGRK